METFIQLPSTVSFRALVIKINFTMLKKSVDERGGANATGNDLILVSISIAHLSQGQKVVKFSVCIPVCDRPKSI